MRRLLLVMMVGVVLLASCTKAPGATTATPDVIAKALFEAVSRGDTDGALILIADDVAFRQEPPGVSVQGKTQLESVLKDDVSWHEAFTAAGPFKVENDKVTCPVTVSGDYFRILGIGSMKATFQLQISNGKIVSILAMPDSDDWAKLTDVTSGGIGIKVELVAQGLKVDGVAQNSPALASGIQVGDVIVATNGINFSGMRQAEMQLRVQGPIGSKVLLSVVREGATPPVDIGVTRADLKQMRYP